MLEESQKLIKGKICLHQPSI